MKLIQTVKILVISQKKLISAALIFYMIILKDILVWLDLSAVHKILIYLIRKLMIVCSDMFLQDQKHLIKQIMKEINKLKDSTVSEKMLTAQKLSSNDILIIIDTVKIKKQLKHSKHWLLIVSQTAKINYCKFTILVHKICMCALNCSKQDTVIKKLLDQN